MVSFSVKSFAAGAGAAAICAYAARSSRHGRGIVRTMASGAGGAARVPAPVRPVLDSKVKLALCQLPVTADKGENIATALSAINEASAAGAKLVVLPEMWNCPYSNESFPVYCEDLSLGEAGSPSLGMMSKAARENGITLVGGSVPELRDGKLYNTCCVFGPDGALLGKHSKVHLFDINIPGGITFKESDTLTPGSGVTVVDTEVGRLGIGICYDIRFPEYAMLAANRGAQILVYPGAFNMVTGPLHWQLLQQARAVDNQCFVAACSPARDEAGPYVAYGHSTVVGPFAEIVATTEHAPDIVYADINLAEINTRRTNMPLEKQRRGDLYTVVDFGS